MIKKKLEEEIKAETLPADEQEDETAEEEQVEEVVDLDSSPVATEEQIEEGNIPDETPGECGGEETAVCEESDEATPDVEEEAVPEGELTPEQESVEKMISQSQLNEIVGKIRGETRDKTLKGVYDRYGVADEAGMDDVVGKSQSYDTLHDEYTKTLDALKEANIKLAMIDSGIAPERYEDARLILQGKGLEVTPDSLKAEMETHPEWKKVVVTEETSSTEDNPFEENLPSKTKFVKKDEIPSSVITALGNEKAEAEQDNEEEIAKHMFGY